MAALKAHQIDTIDLLVVNLYPFEATVAKPGCTLEDAIENIDIGGPAMVRSAAKNWKDVGVLTDASQYAQVLAELKADGQLTDQTKFALSVAAFNRISQYDGAISDYLSSVNFEDGNSTPTRQLFAAQANSQFIKLQDLRYGENPHQQAAFYRDPYPAAGSLVTRNNCRERNFPTTTLLTLTRPGNASRVLVPAAAAPRPASSSSTPTLAVWRWVWTHWKPIARPSRPIRPRPLAASSPSMARSTSAPRCRSPSSLSKC
jgi:hypothetical protein